MGLGNTKKAAAYLGKNIKPNTSTNIENNPVYTASAMTSGSKMKRILNQLNNNNVSYLNPTPMK